MKNETERPQNDAPKMVDKDVVNYGPGKDGSDCLACEHFVEPDRCKRVRGEISPTGTCDLWTSPTQVDGLEFGDSDSIEQILFSPAGDKS